jgi:hypothetical protein
MGDRHRNVVDDRKRAVPLGQVSQFDRRHLGLLLRADRAILTSTDYPKCFAPPNGSSIWRVVPRARYSAAMRLFTALSAPSPSSAALTAACCAAEASGIGARG